MQKGQLDEAIAQYQKALEINANYADARNNLGNVFFRKGELDAAIAESEDLGNQPQSCGDSHQSRQCFISKEAAGCRD